MSQDLISHYRSLLAAHGPSAQAVQWADTATQAARFSVLTDIAPDLGRVLDVGCGLAHLHDFLRAKGHEGSYHGVDIVPEFINHATEKFKKHPNASANLITENTPLPYCDYAILSGVFNNKMDDNWGFMTTTLRRMFEAADRGIAFNAMSSHVDFHDEKLFYVDPMKVFNFCKTELGGHPTLRHDYALREGGFPFEFAIYVYKLPITPVY
ncbi:MAG: class I SAM-dependent methyltransferase [Pseudoruegeria sp.]